MDKKLMDHYNSRDQSRILTFISFMGLFILLGLYLFAPEPGTIYWFQKPLIFTIFVAICILGGLATVYPSFCKGVLEFRKEDFSTKGFSTKDDCYPICFQGHHPDCGHFESHTFRIHGKKYCPGCSGLFVGVVLAVAFVLIYYFKGMPLLYGNISFGIGWVMVFISLLSLTLRVMGTRSKFTANLFLVVGSALLIIGLNTFKGNILVECYFLLLIVFFILTRTVTSKNNHERICRSCQKTGCLYDSY